MNKSYSPTTHSPLNKPKQQQKNKTIRISRNSLRLEIERKRKWGGNNVASSWTLPLKQSEDNEGKNRTRILQCIAAEGCV